MPAGLMVPVEEYLRTSYRPDREYVDGEVIERNLGEEAHSWTQREILAFFIHLPQFRKRVYVEQRVQVKPTSFRVPDVCVVREDAKREPIFHTPPLLCIEVLSKDDSLSEMAQRIDDYLNMGVEACWILDPVRRAAWTATRPGELIRAFDGILRGAGIEMPIEEVLPPAE